MSTLDEIAKEKQRISETLTRVDAQREKLTSQLGELEATERVLARYSKGTRTGKTPPAKTATTAMKPAAPARQAGDGGLPAQNHLPTSAARRASAIES